MIQNPHDNILGLHLPVFKCDLAFVFNDKVNAWDGSAGYNMGTRAHKSVAATFPSYFNVVVLANLANYCPRARPHETSRRSHTVPPSNAHHALCPRSLQRRQNVFENHNLRYTAVEVLVELPGCSANAKSERQTRFQDIFAIRRIGRGGSRSASLWIQRVGGRQLTEFERGVEPQLVL